MISSLNIPSIFSLHYPEKLREMPFQPIDTPTREPYIDSMGLTIHYVIRLEDTMSERELAERCAMRAWSGVYLVTRHDARWWRVVLHGPTGPCKWVRVYPDGFAVAVHGPEEHVAPSDELADYYPDWTVDYA